MYGSNIISRGSGKQSMDMNIQFPKIVPGECGKKEDGLHER